MEAGEPFTIAISRPDEGDVARTRWGEEARIRQRAAASAGRVTIMEYSCPARFGPARHVHREDDETLIIKKGRIVVWSPERMWAAEPGDVVLLPRHVPHTWYNYDDGRAEFTVVLTPGDLEAFFETLQREGTTLDDGEGLQRAGDAARADLIGPPLSPEEVRDFLAMRS